ncbi:hypothetical protein KDL01_04395 [Actinospica durhamensis]|uniref:Uncharacterized protein n=1 Tax=Actinospica durhamensis TaxID=1508375 RepID=A0A941IQ15_9ACTN|nr:hypothetical protein [Actinospica durhamensis]MBR7832483.1 hypothetical protein [Actinospica durhamensis]
MNEHEHEQPGTGANTDPGNARPRDGHGRWLRTTADAHKDARAVQLRTQGMSLDQIAAELGYRHAASALKAISRALAAVPAASVGEYRELQNRQLDYMTATALEMLVNPHPLVTQSGRIVKDPETGEALEDPAVKARALDTLLKIATRRARLLGLDAPTRQHFTMESLTQYTRDLERELKIGDAEFTRFEAWCDTQAIAAREDESDMDEDDD